MSTSAPSASPSISDLKSTPQEQQLTVSEGKATPRAHGAGFRDVEEAISLPHNNMVLVMAGLFITMFLSSLDNTIVTTALPTISAELHGTASDYSWTGVSYMLASGAFVPLWGKLSDVTGRKAILYPSIVVFLLGSGLCGAAKSMPWLIACRAVQGIGGGGIVIMVQVTISDIVTLRDRGKYSAVIGGCWGIANVLGPILGGILTEKASWRWCFWINLPTGGIAGIMLLFLNLNPVKKMTLREFFARFDFLGIFLLMSGTALFLAGLSIAADNGFGEPSTVALVVVGLILLLVAGVVEGRTTRMAVIPPRLFKTRTTLALFGLTYLHAIGFICTTFYLPVVFQGVDGDSTLLSGIKMFPVALGGSFTTILVGPLVTKTKSTRPFIWTGTVMMAVGAGLLITLSESSPLGHEMGFTLLQGMGTGLLFQPPLIALQAAMPLKDMAACTGAFYLVRTLGITSGISMGGVAFQTQLSHRLRRIPGFAETAMARSILEGNYKDIKDITPPDLKLQVTVALSRSLRTIFIFLTPVACVTVLLSLMIRHYSLERNFVRTSKGDATPDAEKTIAPVEDMNVLEK
ncbi:MFS general substrate transporter [Mycena indigotica]|uniref:MFS general substrate transporter n=1 Tax=Mycena indigotica TaxID=2126181 RepID=A0A8H6T4R0_9AGAR|nr:MFS general substrate transporter [Mycena indigotica]KAF7309867.1 MFS general substrate transporter [Mycena indigotica]